MDFLYGNLIIKCHQCGNEEVIEEAVTEGRGIYLFNNHDSFLKLECKKCNIVMEMSIQPSDTINDEDIIEETNEELQEETAKEEDL